MHQKKKNYLGINISKVAKDLYSEEYKILRKETEDDTNKCENTPCLWIEGINIVKKLLCRH